MALSIEYRRATWHREVRAQPRPLALGALTRHAWPVGLYAFALLLLLGDIGGHPGYAYNWEQYTIRDMLTFWSAPSPAIFRPTDGLMTNSGTSPLIVLPLWLAFRIGDIGLAALRVPIALLAGLAVPLLWLLGRRLVGTPAATLGALFLALTPAYLLYARTATLVGLSVTLALATALVLFRVLEQPERRWALAGLQGLLILNTYGYAPLRFLWPLGLGLLGWEALRRWREWRRFLPAIVLTALVLPAFVIAADQGRFGPRKALELYYNAGGEQIRQMNARPDNYETFLAAPPPRDAAGEIQASRAELALRLIGQNARDFAGLLLDRGTKPAITDYWNPQGRLYALCLVPFAALGFGRTLWRARRQLGARVALVLLLGFGLPMLLTSRVHIGRLVFFLPFLLLIAACGVELVADAAHRVVARLLPAPAGAGRATRHRRAALLVLAALVLLAVGRGGWQDYHQPAIARREWRATLALGAALPEAVARGGGIVLIVDDGSQREVEELSVAEYRLALDDRYRFVDLLAGQAVVEAADGRPTIYYGNPLAHFGRAAPLPNPCANLYYVAPALERYFTRTLAQHQAGCGRPPEYRLLPE